MCTCLAWGKNGIYDNKTKKKKKKITALGVWAFGMSVTAQVLHRNAAYLVVSEYDTFSCCLESLCRCFGVFPSTPRTNPKNAGSDPQATQKMNTDISAQVHMAAVTRFSSRHAKTLTPYLTYKTGNENEDSFTQGMGLVADSVANRTSSTEIALEGFDPENNSNSNRPGAKEASVIVTTTSTLQNEAAQLGAIDVEVGANLLRERPRLKHGKVDMWSNTHPDWPSPQSCAISLYMRFWRTKSVLIYSWNICLLVCFFFIYSKKKKKKKF
ncbi:hypothetical protein RFI_14443 [Reticulomyxa filosa]|uniref:Uncharacterized protein n=1 Tax=Reticulomyxa filosa TaxID=46433 RepID=X6N8X9_RETFI|nr:hypothetical protein RFI_14443 [Reticulomyxa filosa]|eukprot:ETO22750.1 hypothetical protein RFI_14443 [Reticulomyxa filosa]